MTTRLKYLALAATTLIGGAIALNSTASASTSPPQIETTIVGATIYPCSNGTCSIGPGNTGLPFAAALDPTGGPTYTGPESNGYQMSVFSGSLPPGLKLALPDAEWMIMGNPTKAGTYTFTIGIVDLAGGPEGFHQFSITIGNGSSDKLVVASPAHYYTEVGDLQVAGFDVNISATYTVSNSATGATIGTLREENSCDGLPNDGDGHLFSNFSLVSSPAQITITDSLGNSITIPVTRK
jgi:hypothetical protein